MRSRIRRTLLPEDMVWHKTDLGPKFWRSDNLVGTDYTSVFSAQLTKFGPGGGSPPHRHTYNHAFYFLRGRSSVPEQRDRTAILGPGGRCLGRRVGCLVWMSRAVRS